LENYFERQNGLTPSWTADHRLICFTAYGSGFYLDGQLPELGASEKIPFLGRNTNRTMSNDVILHIRLIPHLSEKLSPFGKFVDPYNPTIPTFDEISLYGIEEAKRRVLEDFDENSTKAYRVNADCRACYVSAARLNGYHARLERNILSEDLQVNIFSNVYRGSTLASCRNPACRSKRVSCGTPCFFA
jgi:hypothetical protein